LDCVIATILDDAHTATTLDDAFTATILDCLPLTHSGSAQTMLLLLPRIKHLRRKEMTTRQTAEFLE
jgi:hypothetical protein